MAPKSKDRKRKTSEQPQTSGTKIMLKRDRQRHGSGEPALKRQNSRSFETFHFDYLGHDEGRHAVNNLAKPSRKLEKVAINVIDGFKWSHNVRGNARSNLLNAKRDSVTVRIDIQHAGYEPDVDPERKYTEIAVQENGQTSMPRPTFAVVNVLDDADFDDELVQHALRMSLKTQRVYFLTRPGGTLPGIQK